MYLHHCAMTVVAVITVHHSLPAAPASAYRFPTIKYELSNDHLIISQQQNVVTR